MSIFTDPKLGLIPGPVHDQLAAQSRAMGWYDWIGYAAPSVLDTLQFEYFALRNQAALFEISPIHKYRITGPHAAAVLNRLVTRDVTTIREGRVGYAAWCDEEGMVIDDGTLFRLAPDDWRLCCQEPMLTWLLDAALGFDVTVTNESETVAGLALQGPTSFGILEAAGWDIARFKPFDLCEVEPGLMISRTGFTGDLGYELWCDWHKAPALWDRLWKAGANQGLRAIGYEAVNIARIEAGFLTAGVDFQPVHKTERLHRGSTPFEIGLGRMVDFESGHFNGRRALLKSHKTPRSLLMRLDVGSSKPAQGSLIYTRLKREVGHATSAVWSPIAKRSIALAHVKMPWAAKHPTHLRAEIYTVQEGKWDTRMASLTPVKSAFFAPPRATPPGRI